MDKVTCSLGLVTVAGLSKTEYWRVKLLLFERRIELSVGVYVLVVFVLFCATIHENKLNAIGKALIIIYLFQYLIIFNISFSILHGD